MRLNVFRLLRALQLGRPLLLEGPPGVGKTSLVTTLAQMSGNAIVRINLSEQTVRVYETGSIAVTLGTMLSGC